MKSNLFFLSILLFFFSRGLAQEVTCLELISKTKCKDFSCFSDFITMKKFCYDETIKSEYGPIYRFSSCDFITGGPKGINTKNQASIMFIDTGSVSADIGTSSNEYYQRLLNQVQNLGFVSYETDGSEDGVLRVNYKSAKYPKINLCISTFKVSKQYVGDWTMWNLGFRRDK